MWPGEDNTVGEVADGAKSPRSAMLQEEKDNGLGDKPLTKQASTKMVGQVQLPRGLGLCDEDAREAKIAELTTEIIPGLLYLGQDGVHTDAKTIKMKGFEITHILNVQSKGKRYFTKDKVVNEVFQVEDLPSEVVNTLLKQMVKLMDTVRKAKGKLLVVCADKKPVKDGPTYSRSACMIAGFLVADDKMGATSHEAAIEKIQAARKAQYQKPVQINHGFQRQLKQWARECGYSKKK